jgi:transcriptional regulator with XRE-family HTH domain
MNIANQLQELRLAKGLSQGDIERRTGLFRCYVSRVEGGHTLPNLNTLEKWAKALDMELYQLFQPGSGAPVMLKAPKGRPLSLDERTLLMVFGRLTKADKRLLMSMAHKMAATKGKR